MKEGLKRILGRNGDFLFGGLFILVWYLDHRLHRSPCSYRSAFARTAKSPCVAAFALASVLGGVLGLFRLSVLKKTETEQQLLNAFVPLNVLVLSLGMAAFGVLFLHIGWIPP